MSKKKKKPEPEAGPPKFGGFHPLANLKELKDRLASEKLAAQKVDEAQRGAGRAADPKGARPSPAPTSAKRPAPKTSQTSSAEDDLTFHRLMAGVVPLETKSARVPVTSREAGGPTVRAKADEARAKMQAETQEVMDHLSRLVDDVTRFEVTDDGVRVEGRRIDASPSMVRSLRRGLLPIDARIDLHGMSESEARAALSSFLRDKRARGERCVLVIHGKGERVPGSGVLRGEIAAWLSQGAAREHVAAFATASREDGGEGALYVALRR